jgi:hypothetical protein
MDFLLHLTSLILECLCFWWLLVKWDMMYASTWKTTAWLLKNSSCRFMAEQCEVTEFFTFLDFCTFQTNTIPLPIMTQTMVTIVIRMYPGSAICIATAYGLDDQGVGVWVPVGSEFSLLHNMQTGSGAHPASYPMDTWGSFPGGKVAGVWSWPLTSS